MLLISQAVLDQFHSIKESGVIVRNWIHTAVMFNQSGSIILNVTSSCSVECRQLCLIEVIFVGGVSNHESLMGNGSLKQYSQTFALSEPKLRSPLSSNKNFSICGKAI